MPRKNITITDVAKLAGVSVATVSVVINNKKDKFVAPELRQKVLETVAILNYKPNLVARSLKLKETKTIGLILTNITSPVTPPLVRTVQKIARENGFDIFIVSTEEDKKLEIDAVYNMLSKRVDGMIICPVISEDYEHIRYANSLIPVVTIERRAPLISGVITNNKETCYKATQHLIEHGYKNIALISMSVLGSNTQDRIDGYRQALSECGLLNQSLIRETDFIGRSAFSVAYDLLSTCQVDAILTTSQSIALGTYKAVISLGKRIPEEIAIFGYDDVPWMEVVQPALSTTRQPIEDMASCAWDIMFAAMNTEDNHPQIKIIPTELILRASCGCQS
jgi:LacI family transcriptional regulator